MSLRLMLVNFTQNAQEEKLLHLLQSLPRQGRRILLQLGAMKIVDWLMDFFLGLYFLSNAPLFSLKQKDKSIIRKSLKSSVQEAV